MARVPNMMGVPKEGSGVDCHSGAQGRRRVSVSQWCPSEGIGQRVVAVPKGQIKYIYVYINVE